ncbi:hypothetical protein RFI_06295, partial [Reticulomyxa filosa]
MPKKNTDDPTQNERLGTLDQFKFVSASMNDSNISDQSSQSSRSVSVCYFFFFFLVKKKFPHVGRRSKRIQSKSPQSNEETNDSIKEETIEEKSNSPENDGNEDNVEEQGVFLFFFFPLFQQHFYTHQKFFVWWSFDDSNRVKTRVNYCELKQRASIGNEETNESDSNKEKKKAQTKTRFATSSDDEPEYEEEEEEETEEEAAEEEAEEMKGSRRRRQTHESNVDENLPKT